MQTMTLVLCLLQVAGGALPAPAGAQLGFASGSSEGSAQDRTRTATPATNDFASYVDERSYLEEQEFIARFNNLMKALRDFASTYKPGQVIDVKKAKAVRKAMHGLEKSGWFRPQKED
ncbi:MAG: hypothetical protein ABSE86_31475 [Bryobacteraceae bacterium]|jgi:hypothetical protein